MLHWVAGLVSSSLKSFPVDSILYNCDLDIPEGAATAETVIIKDAFVKIIYCQVCYVSCLIYTVYKCERISVLVQR